MLLVGAARAQSPEPPSLEDLLRTERRGVATELAVSTAARQAQSADLAPAVTHVVTRQDIERLGLRNLGDVLRRMPGLDVRQDFEFTRIAVRGIAPGDFNGRVLFLLDGLRLNENNYDAGQIDREFPLDVSLIERVEFAPGPGSALYGGNALLGVVNVVSRRADSLAGPQMRVALSPRGHSQARLSYGARLDGGTEWLAALSSEDEAHVPLNTNPSGPDAAALAALGADRTRRLIFSVRSGGFSLRTGAVTRTRSLGSFLPVADTPAPVVDGVRHGYAHAAWEGAWQAWDLHAALGLQSFRYRNDLPNDEEPELRTDRFDAQGRWWLGELRASRAWGGADGNAHSTSVGLDWQRDRQQRFRFVFVGDKPDDSNATDTRLGLYAQDEWRLAERQRLVLGLRHDASRSDARWSPRAAWVWSPAAGQSLKLLWGTAFRAANRFERSFSDAEHPVPQPERLQTTELAWSGPLVGALPGDWQWQASLFSSQLAQLIERGDAQTYSNQPATTSRGVELGLTGRWAQGWQAQLSLSGQRNRADDGSRQPYSPSQSAKWALQTPLFGPALRLSLSGWASGERIGPRRLPGYAQSQAELLWQGSPQWDAFIGVQNLGGRRYREAAGGVAQQYAQYQGARWQAGWVWRGSGW